MTLPIAISRSLENEKNLPAEQPFQKKDPWISGSHVHQEWKTGHQEKKSQGAEKARGTDSIQIVPEATTFSKAERLLKRSDFLLIASTGRRYHTEHYIIVWSENVTGITRLGVTVTRKTGKAVIRNRIKRYIREYFRLHKRFFLKSDYNIIAKKGADELSFQQVCLELDRAFSNILSSMKC